MGEDSKNASPEKIREMSQESLEELRERAKKFRARAKSVDTEALRDFVEMNAASHEAEQMSEGESFARGFINMVIGTFGKGERARHAKNRGMGMMTAQLFNRAMMKEGGRPEEKLEVTGEEMVKAFNEEMEKQGAPVVAREEGDSVEFSTWDADGEEEQ